MAHRNLPYLLNAIQSLGMPLSEDLITIYKVIIINCFTNIVPYYLIIIIIIYRSPTV